MIYRSGWTYEENIIGYLLFYSTKMLKLMKTTTAIISNQLKNTPFWSGGSIQTICQWMLKSTYSKYLGTYYIAILSRMEILVQLRLTFL